MQVAETILQQLGGNRFIAMTGARNFVGRPASLTFALPGRMTTNGANRVVVELTSDDLYTVEFLRVRGLNLSIVGEVSGVYADSLRAVFEQATGLRTSL